MIAMLSKCLVFLLALCLAGITDMRLASAQSNRLRITEEQAKRLVNPEMPEAIVRPKAEYNAAGLRDPFQGALPEENTGPGSASPQAAPLPTLTVQGVVWGGRIPQAIINNKVVKTGDLIDGVRVINIDKDGVTVFFQGRQYHLSSPAAGLSVNKKP